MKLLSVSIAILVLALGWFIFSEVRGRQKLANIPEPPALSVRSVDTLPLNLSPDSYTAADAQAEVLEELGLTEDVAELNPKSEDILTEPLDTLDNAEVCCEEDESADSDEPKKTSIEIYMNKFLPLGHSREDIERYEELSESDEPLGLEEHTEYWDLLVQFEPNESNIRNYKKWKELKKNIVPGSWRGEWRGK